MTNETDSQEKPSERRAFLKSTSSIVAGIVLTAPLVGINPSEFELVTKAIAQAYRASLGILAIAYGGPFIFGLNRALSHKSLYNASGGVNKDPGSTIDIFQKTFPVAGSYDKSKFGQFAEKILQPSDWFNPAGGRIDPAKYKMNDAPGVYEDFKDQFCSTLDANLRSPQPKPTFLFVGSSMTTKDGDPLKQGGYRFVNTTALIKDDKDVEREHIVMGILCPTDAT